MKQLIASILIMYMGLISCSPKFYSPNTQNVALLDHKGETNITLAGNGDRVELQGAYAVSNNIALQANGGLYVPKDLDNGNGGSGNFVEFGAGYFKPISENIVFETYALIGLGSFENHLPAGISTTVNVDPNISANLMRIGIQPGIGYKSSKFSAAFSSRIASLSYRGIEGGLVFGGEDQVQFLKDNSSNLLIEPAVTLRAGVDKINFQIQIGLSGNLSNSEFRQDDAWGTMGLNFKL